MTNAAVAEVQTSLRGVVEIVFYSGATFSAGKLVSPVQLCHAPNTDPSA